MPPPTRAVNSLHNRVLQMLDRVLEPEVMTDRQEAIEYDSMDHQFPFCSRLDCSRTHW